MTMACKIIISDKQIKKLSFLPAMINEDSQPRFLTPKDREFDDILRYMRKITEAVHLGTRYTVEGNEVVVTP
jgi:hypothetical protein